MKNHARLLKALAEMADEKQMTTNQQETAMLFDRIALLTEELKVATDEAIVWREHALQLRRLLEVEKAKHSPQCGCGKPAVSFVRIVPVCAACFVGRNGN